MSDIFALDADGASSLEDDVRANPLDPAKLPPPMWQGAGDQLKQLVRPSASAGRSLMMAGGAAPVLVDKARTVARDVGDAIGGAIDHASPWGARAPAMADKAPITEAGDWYFKNVVEDVGQNAVDAWTPNAATSGSAAKTLGTALSVAGSLPQMLGLPGVFLADTAIAPGIDTIREGGSTEAALGVAALSLGVNALGFRLPAAFGSTFATRVTTGAGSNLALGIGQNAGTQAILEADGLTEYAKAYDPFNAQSLALDGLMGAAFGLKAHVDAPRLAPSQRAAVLAANNADHFTNLTLPGEPLTPKAGLQHQEAIALGVKQLLNGERVDVSSVIDLSGFALRPEFTPPAIEAPAAPARQWQAKTDTATAIKAAADEMGIDAVDLATVISYETAGTFNPDQAGPTTKWGQHRGLIQFGEPQRAKYGVREGMTVAEQMPAVIAYLRDAGVKPGMSILDVYSAINAGGVGRYDASDTAAGGAPGTVRDKVEGQMAAHRKKAQGMFRADQDAPNFGQAEWPRTIDDADPLWQTIPEGKNGRETVNIDTPEREALRASLVDEHFASLPEPPVRAEGERPIVYVMGGGGGAGKGTILKLLQAEGEIPRGLLTIDPDAIKAGDREHGITGIPEYADMAARGDSRAAAVVHEESSQVAGRVKARGIAERRDMVLDRTLGDPAKALTELRELKAAGYDVQLYGVTLDPAEALDRAGGRAARTGRYVPNANLLTAHKGFAGGFEALVGEVTTARLYDNGGAVPVHIASGQQGALTIHDQGAYNEVGKRSQINENATTYRSIEAAGADAPRDNAGAVREGARGAGPAGGQPGAARDGAGSGAPGQVTDTPAFRRWFGDSKVVDEAGAPLVVYHGTNGDFDTFKLGANRGDTNEGGFFFAKSPALATLFAKASGDRDRKTEPGQFGPVKQPNGENVLPVYVSLKNPKVVDAGSITRERSDGQMSHDPRLMRDAIAQAKADGHDGLIVRDVFEDFGGHGHEMQKLGMGGTPLLHKEDQFVAFAPEQVKSATGNSGKFDPTSADITDRATLTPGHRAAYAALAEMPDLQIIDDAGILRPAAEVLAEGDAAMAQAEETTRAIDAAADCFLRSAA